MSKKSPEIGFVERVRLIRKAGIAANRSLNGLRSVEDDIESVGERVEKLMAFVKRSSKTPQEMIFFVMYDIENNKVRTQVSKYLERKGCVRIQKSIFIAQKERHVFNEIQETLREVQECYDNNDSICIVPVSTDELRSMKVIGQSIDIDLITGSRNTLFF